MDFETYGKFKDIVANHEGSELVTDHDEDVFNKGIEDEWSRSGEVIDHVVYVDTLTKYPAGLLQVLAKENMLAHNKRQRGVTSDATVTPKLKPISIVSADASKTLILFEDENVKSLQWSKRPLD